MYGPRLRRVTSIPSILVLVGMAPEPGGGGLISLRTSESATPAMCVSRAMASTVDESSTAPPSTDRPALLAPAPLWLPAGGLAVTVMSVPIPSSVCSTAACAPPTAAEVAVVVRTSPTPTASPAATSIA